MAVPSSGAISLAGIRAELATNTYNASATTITSLEDISGGGVATINTANASNDRPDGSAPHAMSEFYAYDHDLSSFTDNISFDFDGANDYLDATGDLPAANALETTGTVSMWVKLDSMSANGLMWQITAEEGTDNQLFILYNNAAGVIRGNVKLGGTANLADSGTGLEGDDTWHHIVMTWNSGTKTSALNVVKLYVDGSQTDSDAIGNTWSDESPPARMTFGRNSINNTAFFNGHMNDIAIFSDVLSDSEVTSIYNSGAPKDESSHSGLMAYYTMEEYSDGDTSLVDDSSNSFTLTINNSTNIDSTDTP
jgi:hypothetical protein|tara:strand:- start:238 stop:1164 length:927 start_codon:yes stop_codon:yes gene_type:complete